MPWCHSLQRTAELVPLIGHLGQPRIRRARGRQRRPAGPCHGFQRLLAGPHDRIQPALSVLNLAQFVAFPGPPGRQAGGPPSGDILREGALGFAEAAVKPPGYGQLPLRDRPQYPLILPAPGQGLRTELSGTFGVTAELGEVTTTERDHHGDIHQQAAGPADRGLERLLARTGVGKLCRVDQLLGRLQAAAHGGRDRLRQQQPGPGPDQISGQRGKPPLNRRRFAAQTVDRVEMLLDQPGGPGHLPGGDRVPDRVIGQPALGVPGGRVPVQSREPGRAVPACRRARSRSANRWW